RGQPQGVPEMRGYFQLREERPPDAYLLAVAVDALPPVIFGIARAGWSPTVEMTWHMRAAPAPGLLRVAARSRHVSGGWFDEESEVWDSAGRLSHHHPDHCLDLCPLWVARTFGPGGRLPRVPVYGPRGTARRMAQAYGLEEHPGMGEAFDFVTLAPGSREIGPFRVTVAHM